MVLELKSVRKTFKSAIALNDLSIKIEENEFVALLGNNGSGKTTTIHLLLNFIQPTKGDVRIFGEKIKSGDNDFRKKMGIVLSKPFYIEHLSIKRYLAFVGSFQKIEKKKATERIEELLLLFDLKKNEKSKIRELSSGNKMKVSFISSLIHNPSILILDEPFTNLDIKTIDTISKVLRDLKGLKTILISSHNLDIIYKLCDRFIVIHEGNISLDSKDHVNDDSLKSKITTSLSNSSKLPNPSWLK